MPFTEAGDGPQDYTASFQVTVGPISVASFQVKLDPGSAGYDEEDLDDAFQEVMDHLAGMPALTPNSLVSVKNRFVSYQVTPTP